MRVKQEKRMETAVYLPATSAPKTIIPIPTQRLGGIGSFRNISEHQAMFYCRYATGQSQVILPDNVLQIYRQLRAIQGSTRFSIFFKEDSSELFLCFSKYTNKAMALSKIQILKRLF
jgi:hypothetical protein